MTQKIVQTAEHQLSTARARIKSLEKENRELSLALSQVTPQVKVQRTVSEPELPLRNHLPTSEYRRSAIHSETRLPSFARSTKASRLRQSQSPTSEAESSDNLPSSTSFNSTANQPKPVVVGGKSYFYRNGGLTTRTYLASTKSTINRFRENEQVREARCAVFDSKSATSEAGDLFDDGNEEASDEGYPQPVKPSPTISQAKFDDMIARKGIELRTGLYFDRWVWEPVNHVFINHDELYDILSRAERLAKRCLWRWLRANRPRACESLGLHYLSDMDLGRDRLTYPPELCEPEFYDYRCTKSREVRQVIESLIGLRNLVHHFSSCGHNMAYINEHLYNVQHLAVLLYDEETAAHTRALRTRLRQAAEEVAREIEAVRYLTVLPFAGDHPWQPHHIELLRSVHGLLELRHEFYPRDQVERENSPAVIAASEEYGERGVYMRWDCEPDVEQSLANVQRLAEGGYSSAIPAPSTESHRGRVSRQLAPSRWRSASVNGPRKLRSHGEKDHVRNPARRRSLCLGGAAVDRSLF